MKVLKPGRKQTGWTKEFRCTGHNRGDGGCGAVLLVGYADLFRSQKSHMDKETCTHVFFRCCECGVVTSLGNTDEAHPPCPAIPNRFYHEVPMWVIGTPQPTQRTSKKPPTGFLRYLSRFMTG